MFRDDDKIMHDEAALIETLAISLAFAFVGGFIGARLRLPPLVGYLLACIVVGPFTPGLVVDVHLAPQLAEVGVILLMFGKIYWRSAPSRCRARWQRLRWRERWAPTSRWRGVR